MDLASGVTAKTVSGQSDQGVPGGQVDGQQSSSTVSSSGLSPQSSTEASAVSGSAAQAPQAAGEAQKTSGETKSSEAAGETSGQAPTKKRREIIRADEKKVPLTKKLGQYIVPLIALGVFIMIVVLVYIPFGTEAMESLDEVNRLQEDIDQNGSKVKTLEGIDITKLEDDLSVMSFVVKDEMDVAALASDVEQIALDNNLNPKELSLTDVPSAQGGLSKGEGLPSFTGTINGPFSFYGSFSDITKFLGELRDNSPTILFWDYVDVSRYHGKDEGSGKELWSVDIDIYGFTSPPVSEARVIDPVRTTVNQEIWEEIYSRYEQEGGSETVEDTTTDIQEDTQEGNTDEDILESE